MFEIFHKLLKMASSILHKIKINNENKKQSSADLLRKNVNAIINFYSILILSTK